MCLLCDKKEAQTRRIITFVAASLKLVKHAGSTSLESALTKFSV